MYDYVLNLQEPQLLVLPVICDIPWGEGEEAGKPVWWEAISA